jgi:hypothetical protein
MNDQVKTKVVCIYPECTSVHAPYYSTGQSGQPNGVRLCCNHQALYACACARLPLAVQELHALTQLMPDSYKSRNMEAIAATLSKDDIWHDIVRARERVKEIRTILANCRDNL